MLFYSPCLSEVTLSRDRRSQASLGAHYIGRYSLCIYMCKRIRLTFAQDVVRAVHIRTDDLSIFCAVQAISPSNPLATERVLRVIIRLVGRDRVQIKNAGFCCVAFFLYFY